ncbi:hypothetical protein TNCT_250971, partial [Trichonephila clavata]
TNGFEGSESSEENGLEQESEYNRIPENSLTNKLYQTKPDQCSQSNFAKNKSCEARLQQNQYKEAYQLPVRTNAKIIHRIGQIEKHSCSKDLLVTME